MFTPLKQHRTIHFVLFFLILIVLISALEICCNQKEKPKELSSPAKDLIVSNEFRTYYSLAVKNHLEAENYFNYYLINRDPNLLYNYKKSLNAVIFYLDSLKVLVLSSHSHNNFKAFFKSKEKIDGQIIKSRKELDSFMQLNFISVRSNKLNDLSTEKLKYRSSLMSSKFDLLKLKNSNPQEVKEYDFLSNLNLKIMMRNQNLLLFFLKLYQDSSKLNFNNGLHVYDKDVKNNKSHMLYLLLIMSFLFFILLFYTIFGYIHEKYCEKVEKSEIETLKQKVISSYIDILEMAKTDDPLFTPLFKELYSGFYEKLLRIEPNLTLCEQKTCFYIKLKFSTKEIAEYSFVTPKAIQKRKNRLRKRLFVSDGDNIYSWMNNL